MQSATPGTADDTAIVSSATLRAALNEPTAVLAFADAKGVLSELKACAEAALEGHPIKRGDKNITIVFEISVAWGTDRGSASAGLSEWGQRTQQHLKVVSFVRARRSLSQCNAIFRREAEWGDCLQRTTRIVASVVAGATTLIAVSRLRSRTP